MTNSSTHFALRVLGLMSGTSLDGLDMCLAHFAPEHTGRWQYRIEACHTLDYPPSLRQQLATAHQCSAIALLHLHNSYGRYLGEQCQAFVQQHGRPDIIASHGHTVFHQPHNGLTYQLGSGAHIAAVSGVDTVFDFRTADVAQGGQGAPLVPVGDMLLFGSYTACLNLGGFANISYTSPQGQRVAFDTGPCNMVLNHLSTALGYPYDPQGSLAAQGTVHSPLLDQLNAMPYFATTGAKSLGREWVEAQVIPLLQAWPLSIHHKLCTYCEHIAMQIARVAPHGSMLTTGGGALNTYLITRIQHHAPHTQVVVPQEELIHFKEALIFGLLGALYMHGSPNCLATSTGAQCNSIGGLLAKAAPQL